MFAEILDPLVELTSRMVEELKEEILKEEENGVGRMKIKFKTKAQMNWEIMKEQEKEFIKGIPKVVNGIKTELFLKGIRQTEYRRGKEDALKCK